MTLNCRVAMCDDHRLFVEAVALALAARGVELVATFGTGAELREGLGHVDADVCLVDYQLPDCTGVDLVADASAEHPNVAFLIVSASTSLRVPEDALRAGAAGFASKEIGIDHMISIVRRVQRGERIVELGSSRRCGANDLARLITPREHAVMEKLIAGMDTADVARELSISYATTRTHIQNLLAKLGVHSKLELVAFAVEHRLAPIPPSAEPVTRAS